VAKIYDEPRSLELRTSDAFSNSESGMRKAECHTERKNEEGGKARTTRIVS
jgi:hypothetical protein